jgi:hypothetical protein
MPYERIPTAHIAAAGLRELFERADAYLADVYTMCSGHQLKRTKGGACLYPSTLVLLCVVDAMATYVWPRKPTGRRGDQERRLVTLMEEKLLPWPKVAGWTPMPDAAHILYIEMRNTLTHELGRDKASVFRQSGYAEPTIGFWGPVRPTRMSFVDACKKWPETWPILGPLQDGRGTRDKLTVVALYWAVKRMVKEMAAAA